jgi:hypothetical protein
MWIYTSTYMYILTYLINTLIGSSPVNTAHYATIEEAVFSMSSVPSNSRKRTVCDQLLGYANSSYNKTDFCVVCVAAIYQVSRNSQGTYPCGGGVEYLHRDPVSRRRRRNGKSQIWDGKMWSRVQRGSDQRMTALARASSNCKRQTRPPIRESTPHQQTRNCPMVIKIWS